MMRTVILFVALVCALSASAAYAQYTGPWQQTWTFDSGLGSWYTAKGSPVWVDPATMPNGPTLPDGDVSHGGSANVYLPDQSTIRLDVSSLGLGANGAVQSGKKGFILQADAYLPNLKPLAVISGMPGNGLCSAGVGAEGTGVAIYAEGKANTTDGFTARDFAWDNTARNRSNSFKEVATLPQEQWWDKWVTLQIDYNYTEAGKWTVYCYIPFQTQCSPYNPGWYVASNGHYAVHPDGSAVNFIQLGGMYSWTQAQFDNVKLAYVPEPGSMLALAGGLVGLLGLVRRRK